MAKSKSKAREGLKIPVPLLIIVLAVGGGIAWWLSNRDVVEDKPTWSDKEAGTTAITDQLELFLRSWNAASLDEVRAMMLPVDPDDPDADTLLDRRVEENGWGAGLPTLSEPTRERMDPVRYTVTWPVEGIAEPIVTYWEWHKDRWMVVSWRIPRVN